MARVSRKRPAFPAGLASEGIYSWDPEGGIPLPNGVSPKEAELREVGRKR